MFALAKGTEGYIIDAFIDIKNPYIVEEHDINDLDKYMGGLSEEEIRMFKDMHPISQIKVLSATF